MAVLKVILLALLFTGCATRGEKLRTKYSLPSQKILPVEFISQEKFHCAPAALTMVTDYLGQSRSLKEMTDMLYTPEAKGTFQNDVIAATRRMGLIAIPIKNLKNVLHEINNNNPVLIFQNLGLNWLPTWHYALVVGYNLDKNVMILHSGEEKNFEMKLPTFERIWSRVDEWGLVMVKPGDLAATATEEDMVSATAFLEASRKNDLAEFSYKKILTKWPTSLGSLVWLGNIYYQKDSFKTAATYLQLAVESHPKAAGAWHNYAMVLYADNKLKEARVAANKAIEFSDPRTLEIYKTNLKPILD